MPGQRLRRQAKSPHGLGLAHPIRERGTEWSSGNVSEPEREDRIPAEPPVADGGNRDHPGEEQPGGKVPQVEGRRRQISDRGAHREGSDNGGPVERLSTRGVDAVNRECLLGLLPADEHRQQHHAVEDARHRVGDAEADVEHVGSHSAEHADHDHGQPVRPRHVAAHPELQRQRRDESAIGHRKSLSRRRPRDAARSKRSAPRPTQEKPVFGPFPNAPERIRTSDLRFRRPTLYPAELRALPVDDNCEPPRRSGSPASSLPCSPPITIGMVAAR